MSTVTNPLSGLVQGMLQGRELAMQLRRAADEHQQTQQLIQQRQQDAAMKMIGDRMNLEMMGARPSTNGMVEDMLAAGTPEQSAPQAASPSPSSTASPLDQLRDSAEPPDLSKSAAPQFPNAPAVVAGQPAAVGGIQRKADRSRVVTVPWFGGQKMDYELPTREEQVQRQQQMAENQQLREKLGLEKANQYVLQAFGVPVPDDIRQTLGLPAGMKVLRGEMPALAEKAATVRNQGFKEVPAGGALVNTNPGATGGAAGAPGGTAAGGGAAGANGVVFKNPPLEDPATRAARGYAAEVLGKKPEDVSYEELGKGKADWELLSMNPLERALKQGELKLQPVTMALKKGEVAMQPLEAEQKRSQIQTSAIDRILKSAELDIAGDPNTINQAAQKYLQTGDMPALGRSTLLRGKIMGRASEIAQENGIDASTIPGLQSTYKSLSKSLSDLQTKKQQMMAFERGGKANLDMFIQLARKQIDSGSPLINRTLRGAARTLTGSTDQAEADTARIAAYNEISKIVNGALGNGGLSDASKKEASDLLAHDYTLPQLLRVAQVLEKDMSNRSGAYDTQLGEIQTQMQQLFGPKQGKSASVAGAGQVSVTAPDGSVHTFGDQAAADRFKQAAGIK